MAPFDKHLFICCNRREPGHPRGSCDPTGSESVRANKAGCLDQCEKGPSVVVYPENVWYGRVTEADVNEIVEEHIIGGTPVQRLLMPE